VCDRGRCNKEVNRLEHKGRCTRGPAALSGGLQVPRVIHFARAALYRATALEALRAWPGGLQMGGGVNASNAMEYLDAGASHVIVTSYVFREGRLEEERLAELVCHSIQVE